MTQPAILARGSNGRWPEQRIEEIFAPLEDGRTLHQGWSPQCEKVASPSEDVWGVLKTTSIQPGEFQPEHNKLLPRKLEPRPLIEVKEGDILLTCAGPRARCGVSCLVRRTRKRLMMSGKMYRFRVDSDRTDARYVEAFLQTERARLAIDKMKTGSSDSGLNLTHARFRKLLLPVAPLDEQRRIVAEIEKQFTRLEAGVTALRRVQANLKRYRAAVLKAACEGRLVPTEAELAKAENRKFETGKELLARILTERRKNWNGRGKQKEPAAPQTADLDPLPDGWTWATADQISSQITDGEHIQPRYTTAGFPILSAKHVRSGHIVFTDVPLISKHDFDLCLKRCAPIRDDILIVCVGATTGRAAIVADAEPFALVRSVLLIRSLINPRYLLSWIQSPECQTWIQRASGSSAQAHLYINSAKRMLVPLPPLAEQNRIVAEVERRTSVVEELESLLSEDLQRAGRFRQSILQRAFLGEFSN